MSLDGSTNSVISAEVPLGRTGMYEVWMLAISLSILQAGFGIVTPIFPYYIIDLGVGATELGILASSFAVTRILLAGPLGGLSDSAGRKPVLMASLIGFAIANVIYAFAQNLLVMIIARAIEGAVSAGFFPAANAFVSDVTTPANRGTAMGYLSIGNMVGFILGPVIGGALAQFLGIRLPFIVAALMTLGTLFSIAVLVHEPQKHQTAFIKPQVSLVDVFSKHFKAYTALGVSMFANMFALGILEVAFMLDVVIRFGITSLEIGLFFGVIGAVMIVGNIGFGYLSDHHGRKWLIVFGAVLGALSLIMFIIATDIVGFFVAGAFLAIAMSMRGPTIQALIGDLTDQEAYGVVMGAFGAVSNGAYAVSPLMSGMMFDSSGNSISSLALAAVVSLAGGGVAAIGLPSGVVSESKAPGIIVDDAVIGESSLS